MKYLIILILSTFYFGNLVAEISNQNFHNLFNVGKMESYNKEFTLYFKPRNNAILARGEERNYIKDYPEKFSKLMKQRNTNISVENILKLI